MPIPSLTPILDAVLAVRAQLEPDAERLAAQVLAGDAQALAEGRELLAAVERLRRDLQALAGPAHVVEHLEVEEYLGVANVVDAVLIAIGEIDSDDPAVNERFRQARMEFARVLYERTLSEVKESRAMRPLTVAEIRIAEMCSHDLDLIAAGIEPA